ncbi:MAG: asparaginase [Paracoccaceae bacterium]
MTAPTLTTARTVTTANPVLVEIWRGDILECTHRGAAAIATPTGEVVEAWGDVSRVHLPRSACKMIQALPMVESGAADAAGLDARHLALACASHGGTAAHTSIVAPWLAALGLGEAALRCGSHPPLDAATRSEMRAGGGTVTQIHHQCSGKHSGFLTLSRHLAGDPDYHAPDHPVQRAVRAAMAETCGEDPAGPSVDGCSAPNFAVTLQGLATAMARYAAPEAAGSDRRATAMGRLRAAMKAHPVLIGYPASWATRFTWASTGGTVTKSGADGGFAAILPERGLGIAVKIDDGDERAAAAVMAALLARCGVLDRADPSYRQSAEAPIVNVRGIVCGGLRVGADLSA